MAADVFPSTMRTWIDRGLDGGDEGRREVNAHVMRTYAKPLKVYFLGSRDRWLGEADEVVDGFFAGRLARPDFFENWQASELRLRRWLMNGFCYYLMELRRERKRHEHPVEDPDEPYSGDPDRDVDQATLVSLVRQAMEEAWARCREEGLEEHWSVFRRHHHDDVPFGDIAEEMGIDAARAAVMSRTAKRKFQAAMRDVIRRDGVPEDEIDQEIQDYLEVSGS